MIWEHAAYPRGKVHLDDDFIFEVGNAALIPTFLRTLPFSGLLRGTGCAPTMTSSTRTVLRLLLCRE